MLDFGVIMPRLQQLHEWSARELDAPGLLDCVRDGSLIYAWSYDDRSLWHPTESIPVRVAPRMLPPEGQVSPDRNRSRRWPCCHPVDASWQRLCDRRQPSAPIHGNENIEPRFVSR